MLSWTMLRIYCALAAYSSINNTHAASPTQPIHRSILSHRRRTVVAANDQNGRSGGVLRTANGRRRTPDMNRDEEEPSSHKSTEEPTAPLLLSPFWVKIHEEFGQNSWNFIPGSRRAASSVVYAYTYNDNDRILQEEDEGSGAGEENSDGDAAINSTADNLQVENNSTMSSNSTTTEHSTKEEEPEAKTSNITTSGSKQGETSDSSKQQQKNVEEYMIISGGYTDRDWSTFPVYAFPITSAIRTLSGQWIDLSPPPMDANVESQCAVEDTEAAQEKLYQEAKFFDTNSTEDVWMSAESCAPFGRMGHQSAIHNGKLYVFGGLIYDEEQVDQNGYRKKETFRLEDIPFVYRLDLNEMFKAREAERQGNRRLMQQVTGWQRIIPRVKRFSTHPGMVSSSAAEVLLTSINRGEMQGGLWSSEGGHDKLVMYGGLRIAKVDYGGPSKFVKGDVFGPSSQMKSHKIVELPLGDVWAYDLVDNCWEKLTSNYGRGIGVDAEGNSHEQDDSAAKDNDVSNKEENDDWYADLDADYSNYPRPRTAHAACVVDNQLIIHGGMGWDEHTNDWDGSTDWEGLDDMWIFDLDTREWTRRYMFPLLVRSYHSLVGWNVDDENMMGWGKEFKNFTSYQGPVAAAFGGYTSGVDVFSGEEVAYVFDKLLISLPPEKDTTKDYGDSLSLWLKANMDMFRDKGEAITNRYEHSAILTKQGVLAVWGGSFQSTELTKGVWMINVAGHESTLDLTVAESDSIYDDYQRTITALHTIVLMLIFMSISLTLLLGLTQRYQELVSQANEDAAVLAGFPPQVTDSPPSRRGNGLHPEIIETIPRKIYSASENDLAENGEQECCPICLLEYADGDELRVLPCNHYMHTQCLDAWLANHPSCPSCRHSLSELVDDSRPMMQLRTLRSRLSNNNSLARFLGNELADGEIVLGNEFGGRGIEMNDISLPTGAVIDLRYLSSLALSEEDTEPTERQGEERQQSTHQVEHTAMREISDWRRRRMQLRQARRRSGLESFRQNVSRIRRPRRSRIPLVDMDEE